MPVCEVMNTCDYAVAIFGGWNQLTDKAIYLQQQDNMETMKNMLERTGFDKNKIQIFYHEKFKMLSSGKKNCVMLTAYKINLQYTQIYA